MSFIRWFWVVVCVVGSIASFLNILEGDVEQPVWLSAVMFASFLGGAIGSLLKNKFLVLAPAAGIFARLILLASSGANTSFLIGSVVGSLVPLIIMLLLFRSFSGKIGTNQ